MTQRRNPLSLLGGLRPPSPPPDLRARCLESVCVTPAAENAIDFWSRLWVCPTARWAWVLTVAVLTVIHGALSISQIPSVNPSPDTPFLVAGRIADNELADLVDFRPLRPYGLLLLDRDPITPESSGTTLPERS